MSKMPVKPEWLNVSLKGHPGSIDREKGTISGVILAEEGMFKDRRGEFDREGIREVVRLAKEKNGGLLSRFTHPNLSSDGLSKHLGRMKNVRSDKILRDAGKDASGKPLMREVLIARGDLHFNPTALQEPVGGGKPLGVYVMDLAETDPEALMTSLVLKPRQEFRLDKSGRPLKDEKTGEELPPLWFPEALHGSDVVADGDATHSFLSADILAGLPDAIVRQGCELLDKQFGGQAREVVEARLNAFKDRYLALRFGDEQEQVQSVIAGALSVSFAEGKQRAIENGEILTGNGVEHPPIGKFEPVVPEPPAHSDEAIKLELFVAIEEASV